MYHRIIVPIEAGMGLEALATARPLARELGCALTVLHVHRPREAPAELEALPQFRFQHVVESWDHQDMEAEGREADWLAGLASAVTDADPDLAVSGHVVHGPLAEALRTETERFLIVTSSEESGEGPGPATRELIHAGAPVLLSRPGHEVTPIRRILVPLDGSQFSLEVIEPALDLARGCGARITLLVVASSHGSLVRLLHPGEQTAESAERFLRQVGNQLAEELGPVDYRVVESEDPPHAIVSEAARGGFDLIAMATHGRGGLRRLLLGSVAERVVRESDVPVLVYRPTGLGASSDAPVWSRAIAH